MAATDPVDSYLKFGSSVWVGGGGKDKVAGWRLAQITSTKDAAVAVQYLDSSETAVVNKSDVHPANPAELFKDGPPEDIIKLSHLNEPSIYHLVQARFSAKDLPVGIYTNAGPVLVAVNPCCQLSIYSEEYKMSYIDAYNSVYKGQQTKHLEDMPPHVYRVAGQAFRRLSIEGESQALVVSGESGAGKTETTKKLLGFFASLSGASDLGTRMLKSNPILEAFGNAKTSRNHNSSRFGKLLSIRFRPHPVNRAPRIAGASIRTYLLEKSRVVGPAKGERNYHVFYQMLRGASEEERQEWRLPPASTPHPTSLFKYLRDGEEDVPHMDDAVEWSEMRSAMQGVGVAQEEQSAFFSLLAGILWLGNVAFVMGDNDCSTVDPQTEEAFQNAAALLEFEPDDLKTALTKVKFGGQGGVAQLYRNAGVPIAEVARDSLAKAIYSELFDHIVRVVNSRIEGGCGDADSEDTFINLLDIFGFEHFPVNSFEQLCINYANERLQQLFCRHLFQREQAEYQAEGLEWALHQYTDNSDTLQLLDSQTGSLGIFPLLNEFCMLPEGSEERLALHLKQQHEKHPRFEVPRTRREAFKVHHFADAVEYSLEGMLDKNKDFLGPDLVELMAGSRKGVLGYWGSLLQQAMEAAVSAPGKSRKGARNRKTFLVAFKFKSQVDELISELEECHPHFIRCVKPNADLKPGLLHQPSVLAQLRCAGVVEVANIYKKGFPTRYTYSGFLQRYNTATHTLLAPIQGSDPVQVCRELLTSVFRLQEERDFVMGKTMVFFRAGRVARVEDEWARRHRAADLIASLWRRRKMWRLFNMFVKRSTAALRIQRAYRYHKQQVTFKKLREVACLLRDQKEQQRRAAAELERQRLATLEEKVKTAVKLNVTLALPPCRDQEELEYANRKLVTKIRSSGKCEHLTQFNSSTSQGSYVSYSSHDARIRSATWVGRQEHSGLLQWVSLLDQVVSGTPDIRILQECATALDKAATQFDDNLQSVMEVPNSLETQFAAANLRREFSQWCADFEANMLAGRAVMRMELASCNNAAQKDVIATILSHMSHLRDVYYNVWKGRFSDVLEEAESVELPKNLTAAPKPAANAKLNPIPSTRTGVFGRFFTRARA